MPYRLLTSRDLKAPALTVAVRAPEDDVERVLLGDVGYLINVVAVWSQPSHEVGVVGHDVFPHTGLDPVQRSLKEDEGALKGRGDVGL